MNHEKRWLNFCTMTIFLTYNSFKTWGDVLLISCREWHGHAAAEIENASGIDTPVLLRSDPFLKPSVWLNVNEHWEVFSLLVSLSLTFNVLQLFFLSCLQENKPYRKKDLHYALGGVIRLKIRSSKSAIIPFFKCLWLWKFESLLS